ncbi:MAG: GNAT family N-acetyltransferase [Chloroflexales bacterium]|nr:GNAT family N-acetyltransferase [Chloroflexales bacterium]
MTQPIYRLLAATDLERFIEIETLAFNINPDRSRLTPQVVAQLRALYDGDRILAQLQLMPLQIMAGSANLPCGGIGSVATPPEARRQGHVAALMRHVCDEIRSQGIALCMLYPFNRSFYHRYGWAMFMERRVYRGSPELFAHFCRSVGDFVQVGPEAIPELQQIYAGALRGRFGPVVRDETWWQRDVLRGWGNETYYAYIWRDSDGVGRAYLIYQLSPYGQPERRLTCREIVALDPEARSQLFVFLRNYDSQCDEVLFRAPADAPVNMLMIEPLRCEIEPHFMLRLIDVGVALETFPYPPGSAGRLRIAVTDDWLKHNKGVFELEIAGGQARCKLLPSESDADLACDVRVLTQIYARYLRARSAAAFGLLTVNDRAALALLDRLFAGLAPFNSDFF